MKNWAARVPAAVKLQKPSLVRRSACVCAAGCRAAQHVDYSAWFKLTSLLLVLAGCPAVEKTVVLRVGAQCLTMPPPKPDRVLYVGPPACSEIFTACLTSDAASTLESNLVASKRWETEAWLRCGPVPDAGSLDGGR